MKSLFFSVEHAVKMFLGKFDIQASENFIACADQQLSRHFERLTGISINKRIAIVFVSFKQEFYYQKGEISKLPFQIYINDNLNAVVVAWKSKSGRIYDLNDSDIHCDDIDFWFEGLNPLLYHKQLNQKEELPFKLKDLTFNLKVESLNIDCIMNLIIKLESNLTKDAIAEKIDEFINDFNGKSEKKNRKDGLVHNAKHTEEGNVIKYEIDLGSAGPALLKKMLPFMSKLNCFDTVEIC